MIDTMLIDRYLDRVILCADRHGTQAEDLRRELHDHLMEKIEHLVEGGMSPDKAVYTTLRQNGNPSTLGYRFRPPWRWVDVRAEGTARGIIAIGPRAVGIFAFGGQAAGVVAFGGVSAGVVSLGGVSLGIFALGGTGVGLWTVAGMAIGAIACGGSAFGLVAAGQQTTALWVPANTALPAGLAWLEPLALLLPTRQQVMDAFPYALALYSILLIAIMLVQFREQARVRAANEEWLWG